MIHRLTDKSDLGSGNIGLLISFLGCEESYLAIHLVWGDHMISQIHLDILQVCACV